MTHPNISSHGLNEFLVRRWNHFQMIRVTIIEVQILQGRTLLAQLALTCSPAKRGALEIVSFIVSEVGRQQVVHDDEADVSPKR